jgi:hypothetical protein
MLRDDVDGQGARRGPLGDGQHALRAAIDRAGRQRLADRRRALELRVLDPVVLPIAGNSAGRRIIVYFPLLRRMVQPTRITGTSCKAFEAARPAARSGEPERVDEAMHAATSRRPQASVAPSSPNGRWAATTLCRSLQGSPSAAPATARPVAVSSRVALGSFGRARDGRVGLAPGGFKRSLRLAPPRLPSCLSPSRQPPPERPRRHVVEEIVALKIDTRPLAARAVEAHDLIFGPASSVRVTSKSTPAVP